MKKACVVIIAALILIGMILFAGAASAETIISSILVDYQQTFSENRSDLAANGGKNVVLGDGNGSMKMVNDGLMLIALENENPMFNLVRRLDEVDGIMDGNQALHIRFMSSTKDFGIMLYADSNAGFTIGENNEPLAFVSMGQYIEPLSGHLFLQPGKWYHALLAMRSDGVMQVAVWLEEEESNLAGGYVHIGSAFGEGVFQNQSWEVSLGFQGNATFTISNYEYLTFSGFVMDYQSLETNENPDGDMQNDMDLGPSWSFNIADSFDIISDSVWRFVESQSIDAAGDTFMGYNLADLMVFSGNGWDMATVSFEGENAQSALVRKTYDSFIVYQRNGEFLEGPYLLSVDGLSEYPVAQVFRYFAIPLETAVVISTVISDWHSTYDVLTQDLIADNGESFHLDDPDNHHVMVSVGDEGVTFTAKEGSSPQLGFGQQMDVEGTIDHKQAVHVKFKPSGKHFNFSLWANFGLWFNIGDQNEPYLGLMEKHYAQPFEGDLRVEPGEWYHLFVAITPDGVLQSAMWKNGDENNVATLNLDLFQSFNEPNYQAEAWELCVSVTEQESITLSNYEYITFENYAVEGKVIETAYNDIQENGESADYNDFGPPWTINIADNSEIVYNTIWDVQRPQIVAVASGEYVGYTLWDLLELTDNGSGVATVWFNGDGENNTVVSPTYDAFIVFATYENWEWMGAPYLITIDGLWPDPVTHIYP